MISREKLTTFPTSERIRVDGDLSDLCARLQEVVKAHGPEVSVSLAWNGERGWKLVVERAVAPVVERGR